MEIDECRVDLVASGVDLDRFPAAHRAFLLRGVIAVRSTCSADSLPAESRRHKMACWRIFGNDDSFNEIATDSAV
jgi:hypothetical protein